MVEQRTPPTFILLANHEFQKLSTEEKAAYLRLAADALKAGAPVVTPNGEFEDPEDSIQ